MDFQSYLKITAEQIDQEIDRFFVSWLKEVEKTSPSLVLLAKAFADNCMGGKRLRGALVKLGYEIVNGSSDERVIKPAAAVEIFQSAILAHDDIIDKSPTRRGKPTLYHQLGGEHYGISQTIALADIGFFLAVRLIANSNFPTENKNRAISCFAETVINTGLGEVLDVELPYLKGDKVEKDVITIHKLKTSYYTIIDPLCLGAILAGGEGKLLDTFKDFGENLGIAFQIQDDILGIFGDEKVLGKSVTSDIEEGKNTTLITYATEHASSLQKDTLEKYYGKEKIDQDIHAKIKQVFIDCGALEYSKQKAQDYVNIAKEFIPAITSDPQKAQLLQQMADFLVNRDK